MTAQHPNVVLFMSDQQRADAIAAGGVEGIHTPHLDWIANDGTLFERAYCPYPICSPSRRATFSGLYPHSNGMVANHQVRPGCDLMRYPQGVRNLGDYLVSLAICAATLASGIWAAALTVRVFQICGLAPATMT